MSLLSLTLTFFLVFDPFGNIGIFHAILSKLPPQRRRPVFVREALIALAVMALFLFCGQTLFTLLGIQLATLSISGGIILFLIALGMLFPVHSVLSETDLDSEPFIVPLAMPLFAGPSAIALALLMTARHPEEKGLVFLAAGLAWLASSVILFLAPSLLRLLGSKGNRALERLMGLLLILISIQMFLDGLASYQASLHP